MARASKRLSRTATLSASGREEEEGEVSTAAAGDAAAAALAVMSFVVASLATHLPLTRFFKAIAAACATSGLKPAAPVSAARRSRAGAAPGESWACSFFWERGGREEVEVEEERRSACFLFNRFRFFRFSETSFSLSLIPGSGQSPRRCAPLGSCSSSPGGPRRGFPFEREKRGASSPSSP